MIFGSSIFQGLPKFLGDAVFPDRGSLLIFRNPIFSCLLSRGFHYITHVGAVHITGPATHCVCVHVDGVSVYRAGCHWLLETLSRPPHNQVSSRQCVHSMAALYGMVRKSVRMCVGSSSSTDARSSTGAIDVWAVASCQ